MTDDAISSDLADLRKEFEGSGFTFGSVWASAGAGPDARRLFASHGTLLFGSVWASAGAGPDARRLFASHGTLLITSWNAAELRMRIREEDLTADAQLADQAADHLTDT